MIKGGMFMNCIEDEFLFHKNDIIVVGCSAGPDSMGLG